MPFYGLTWTASGGSLITSAGDYVLDTATGVVSAAPLGAVAADGQMHFSVGAGQAAGMINFAWGATTGIRVINVWNVNSDGSLTAAVVPGMENGPFPGFNAAFNLAIPAICPAVEERCDYVPPEITPSIPEAETYAMMLAGLTLVGIAAARRSRQRRG